MWHERGLLAFDLETTGPDPMTARTVTWAVAGVNPDGSVAFSRGGIVNPGVEISADAAAIHGITTEKARAKGVKPETYLDTIKGILDYFPDLPVVGFNVIYDLTILVREAVMFDYLDLAAHVRNDRPVIDALVLDKAVDKWRKGSRRLQPTCELYEIALDDWHSAEADCVASARLAQAIAGRYPELRCGADELHQRQVKWRAEQAAGLEAYLRRKDKTAVVDRGFPVQRSVGEVAA